MPRKLVRRVQPEPAPEPEPEEAEEPQAEQWTPTPLLLNVDDACLVLGKISKQMLYRLIQLGELHRVKIGSRSLFTMSELTRYVQEREDESLAG